METRGGDPHAADEVARRVSETLQDSIDMLQEEMERAGISGTDTSMPRDAILSTRGEELERAASDYVAVMLEVVRSLADHAPPLTASVTARLVMLAGKCARVASYLTADGLAEDDAMRMDGIPNLLLIERLLAGVEDEMTRLRTFRPVEARRAHEALTALLMPLLAAVPRADLRELARRVLTRSAPSPFCTDPSAALRARA